MNLVKIQEELKGMPMQALMGYANGQNPDVPPFAALAELNRRKTMEQGGAAAAMSQGQPPTVKDSITQATGIMGLQQAKQAQAMQQMAQQGAPGAAPPPTSGPQQAQGFAEGGKIETEAERRKRINRELEEMIAAGKPVYTPSEATNEFEAAMPVAEPAPAAQAPAAAPAPAPAAAAVPPGIPGALPKKGPAAADLPPTVAATMKKLRESNAQAQGKPPAAPAAPAPTEPAAIDPEAALAKATRMRMMQPAPDREQVEAEYAKAMPTSKYETMLAQEVEQSRAAQLAERNKEHTWLTDPKIQAALQGFAQERQPGGAGRYMQAAEASRAAQRRAEDKEYQGLLAGLSTQDRARLTERLGFTEGRRTAATAGITAALGDYGQQQRSMLTAETAKLDRASQERIAKARDEANLTAAKMQASGKDTLVQRASVYQKVQNDLLDSMNATLKAEVDPRKQADLKAAEERKMAAILAGWRTALQIPDMGGGAPAAPAGQVIKFDAKGNPIN